MRTEQAPLSAVAIDPPVRPMEIIRAECPVCRRGIWAIDLATAKEAHDNNEDRHCDGGQIVVTTVA